MNVSIRVINHKSQRYPTTGDWFWYDDELQIRVSAMGHWRYEMLVAAHELAEALACHHAGISEKDVTAFDLLFEEEREAGKQLEDAEPGDDRRAPYFYQHQMATTIEHILASVFRVSWKAYEKANMALYDNKAGGS